MMDYMKRLYSIFLILFLAGCSQAGSELTAVPRSTLPPEWLTRPPTPIIIQGAAQTIATPAAVPTLAPVASLPPTAVPSPTTASLLKSLFSAAEPERTPLSISALPGVPADLIAVAQQLAAAQPAQFQWIAPGDASADITLTLNDGQSLAQWIYVVAAPFATIPDSSSSEEIAAAWTAVAAPETPLILSTEETAMLSALWGAPGPTLTIVPPDDLRESLWAERPSRTILPFQQLTPDLKVLALDGQSPFDPEFAADGYPLTVPITVQGDETAVASFLAAWNGPPTNFDPRNLTTIAMTGVTALVRATASQMEIDGILAPGRDVGPLLRAADFAHISNEVSFAPDCPEPNPIGGTSFCSQDDYFALLTDLGTDIIELTGNHLNDWGTDNLLHTLDMYDQAGMRTFGGGRDAAQASLPLLLEHNGNRIALIGCNYFGPAYAWATESSPGSAVCDPEFLDRVRDLKDQGYTVIATQQYTEYYQYPPMPDQAADFRAIAEAGADAVSGSQGHHAQGFDFEGDSFIHYGLGNLFFDQMDMQGTRETFVDTLSIYDGRLINVSLWTGLIENYYLPRLMTPAERSQTLQTVFDASGW
jgi:poly-gamma-glutamate synthesis protein (capsule biosynthesis protein)